jgi:branched-chain amino acid transport system substrate-binding protein
MRNTNFLKIMSIVAVVVMLNIGMLATALAKDENTLYIGSVLDFASFSAPFDVPADEGVKLAIDEINAAGGIGGKYKIKLAVKDYRGEAEPAIAGTKELLADGVDVVLGSGSVTASIVVGGLTAKKKVPMITITSSGPEIPTAVGPYGFTNTITDNRQGATLAQYAIEQGYKTAYILRCPDDPYTDLLPVYFAKAFEKLGGKIVGTGTWTFTQQEFSVEVGKIKKLQTQPDVIMSATFGPFFAGLITSLRSAGVKTPVFAPDAIDEPSSIGLGVVAEGVVFTSAVFAAPGSSMEAFNKKYKAKYGKENTVAPPALGYDAVKLIEAAVLKAGSTDGSAIRDALETLVDVQGASGKLTYAGGGRNMIRAVAVCKIENGQKALIKWMSPALADIPQPE